MGNQIEFTIKFFSGLEKEIKVENYDPVKGLKISAGSGTRLKKVLKGYNLKKLSSNVYFRNGERIGLWSKLKNGDEVSCLKPSGGG